MSGVVQAAGECKQETMTRRQMAVFNIMQFTLKHLGKPQWPDLYPVPYCIMESSVESIRMESETPRADRNRKNKIETQRKMLQGVVALKNCSYAYWIV